MSRKKCIPGIICIENTTLYFIIIIILILLYILYYYSKQIFNSDNKIVINQNNHNNHNRFPTPDDVLLNPYTPPLRNERYFNEMPIHSGVRIPINIPTNRGFVDVDYRQVGLLTPTVKEKHTSKEKILPLMGKPLFSNRDKWNYYTMSDQNNSIKLPILSKGRSCTSENGCDVLYNGDVVFVEGYKEAFKITLYDNDTIRYLPFL